MAGGEAVATTPVLRCAAEGQAKRQVLVAVGLVAVAAVAAIAAVTTIAAIGHVGAIRTVYDQVLGPKAVVAIGSCPATTNVFIDSRTLDGPLNKHVPVDVFVPGCPPRPDAIVEGIAKAAAILAERGKKLPAPEPAAELTTEVQQ